MLSVTPHHDQQQQQQQQQKQQLKQKQQQQSTAVQSALVGPARRQNAYRLMPAALTTAQRVSHVLVPAGTQRHAQCRQHSLQNRMRFEAQDHR